MPRPGGLFDQYSRWYQAMLVIEQTVSECLEEYSGTDDGPRYSDSGRSEQWND